MVWFIYRRSESLLGPRQKDRLVRSFDGLFDLLLKQLLAHPRLDLQPRGFVEQRSRPFPEGLQAPAIGEQHQGKMAKDRGEPATYPCSCCGMKFSANLMKDSTCQSCSSAGRAESQRESPGDRGACKPFSSMTVRQAYQVLGCDEKDSDETNKRRHRELAKQFHTDLLSRRASRDRIEDANERFCKAQEAYEIILIARKKVF